LTEVQSPRSTTGVDVGASAEPSRGKDCLDYGSPGGYPPDLFTFRSTRALVALAVLSALTDSRSAWTIASIGRVGHGSRSIGSSCF
jgi:hypothetical protein